MYSTHTEMRKNDSLFLYCEWGCPAKSMCWVKKSLDPAVLAESRLFGVDVALSIG